MLGNLTYGTSDLDVLSQSHTSQKSTHAEAGCMRGDLSCGVDSSSFHVSNVDIANEILVE